MADHTIVKDTGSGRGRKKILSFEYYVKRLAFCVTKITTIHIHTSKFLVHSANIKAL